MKPITKRVGFYVGERVVLKASNGEPEQIGEVIDRSVGVYTVEVEKEFRCEDDADGLREVGADQMEKLS